MDKEKNRLIAVAAAIVVIVAIIAVALVLTGGDDRGGDDGSEGVLFDLTVSSNDGGIVTPAGTSELAEGTTQTITITPDSGYKVSDVLLDGESVGAVTSLEVVMDEDHKVEVVFGPETDPAPVEHTITASAGAGGRISPSGEVKVADGADQKFTFTANGSYRVSQVTVDGKAVTVTGNSYTFEDVSGDHTISVTFRYVGGGGGGTTPSVTLTGIKVTEQPDRTSYLAGETFDKTGMVITASYSNGTTKTVEDYSCSPSGALTVDVEQVTVTYQGKTATVDITVIAAESEIQKIEVTTLPDKTHYFDDQMFDDIGMEVSAVYDGDVKIPLDSSMYEASEDKGTGETRTVTVTLLEDGSKWTTLTISRNNTIMDVEELKHFRDNVNDGVSTYSGITVTLGANLDLNNEAWTPIGPNADDDGKKFKGTFDGGNHIISNLNVKTKTGYTAAGFFGALNGIAKNFTIDGVEINHISKTGLSGATDNGIAVVAGSIYQSGTIENVNVKNATVEGNRYVGGIAGYVYGSVIDCTVEDTVLTAIPDNLSGKYDNGDKVGGIIGYASTGDTSGEPVISGCTVKNVTISGYRNLGGIAGAVDKSPAGCTVENVTITHDRSVINTEHEYGNQSGIILGTRTFTGTVDTSNKVSGIVTTDDVDVLEGAINLASDKLEVHLASGTYTPVSDYTINITKGKSVMITPVEGAVVVFDGRFVVYGSLDVSDITMNTSHEVNDASQYTMTGVGLVNTGSFTAENVVFLITLDGGTAITAWWSTENGTNINVTDCTFVCEGQRPIRSDGNVTVENCTFNDPYRYAVQMTSKASTMTAENATVNFNNNTINAGNSTNNPVYGIQLEGETYGCHDLVINGSGNTIQISDTGKDSAMYYCECGLVHCEYNPENTPSITWNVEVDPVHESVTPINSSEGLLGLAKSTHNVVFEKISVQLTDDIDMSDVEWTPIYINGNIGSGVVTIEGNNHTIYNLNAPLFAGGFAGKSGIIIRNLTISDSEITGDEDEGVGAFVKSADSMTQVTLENCHLVDSTITSTSKARVGGLIGWTSGYESVQMQVNVKGCSVVNCTITANGSVGAIIGHSGANPNTFTYVEDCTVENCTLTSTDSGSWRVGVVVGTANVGEMTITDITSSGNTLIQTDKTIPENQRDLYGRFVPDSTGKLTIDGKPITV